jgi:small subunit ribosomal protein S17
MADDDEIVDAPETAEEAAPEAEVAEPEAADEAAPEAEVAEATSAEAAPAAAPARAEPAEVLAPKERRRRARAAKARATRPAREPAERQAVRDETRAKNAAARRHARGRAHAERPATTVAPAQPVEAVEHAVGRPKVRQGIVVSNKADKTITVRVDTSRRHRRYKKIVRSRKTFHAHDERNEAGEGDLVRIVESRPLSATKRWRLVEILERAE